VLAVEELATSYARSDRVPVRLGGEKR